MQFEMTDDQRDLQQTVRAFLARHATPEIVRAAAERHGGFDTASWTRITGEMELTALALDPALGGSGAGFQEVAIVLQELGRTLLPVPFLPTVVAAQALVDAGDADAATAALGRIAGGAAATASLDSARLTAAGDGVEATLTGELAHVVDGPHAALLVAAAPVADECALFVLELDGPGVEVIAQPTLDLTRRQATVRLDRAPAVRISSLGRGEEAVARARHVRAVARAAEAVGAASRCLEITVAYLCDRVQFGRPIGSFQALKHRCADQYVALEGARSTAGYAAWAVDGAPDELPVLAPLAELVCSQALLQVSAEAIQMHGGIGFTWEHDAHLYFKRAKSSELLAGGHGLMRRIVGNQAGII